MKVIGLTGGIGSGKTTVSQIFALLNIPIYIADEKAKEILASNLEIQRKVISIFGEKCIQNGIIDRKFIARESFGNADKLKQLNAIIHPAVAEDFRKWKMDHSVSSYVIKEAAILFESGSFVNCDKTILVTAPVETRIQRVISRDKVTKVEVEARIKNQWSEEKKKELADFIINNNEGNSLIAQVMKVHEILEHENS